MLTTILALVAAVLGAVSVVLHFVSPRTETTFDDMVTLVVDEVLAYLGQHDPHTGEPADNELQ